MWSLTLVEDNKLQFSENDVRKICGPKGLKCDKFSNSLLYVWNFVTYCVATYHMMAGLLE
jgi:hypothetical protein